MSLTSRTAVVTGASQGIGRAIAVRLAEHGADVVVTARSTDKLEAVANEIRGHGTEALPVTADLANESDIERVVAEAIGRFGRIDILVNNAAIIHPRIDVVDLDPDTWRSVLNVNLTGAFLLTRAAIPHMIERGAGKSINISSIGGRHGARGRSAYRVTKAGLINLTETLAAELKQHGIDVNCICPGGVDTEGYREAFNSPGGGKLMRPEEIADIAAFLASDASSSITGTAIDAFGGGNPLFG